MPFLKCCKKQEDPLPSPRQLGVEEALKVYYKAKVLPLEQRHDYDHFFSPPLDDAEFDAKPSVLLVGQYSVGKTTMIRYLLGADYPGSSIGPEPTTDCFMTIVHGQHERLLLGNTMVTERSFPFKSLSKFGNGFLSKLRGAICTSPLLEHLIFIDTPGILSGEKQRVSRGYDFHEVCNFLANKVDRILLLFDISKLDISDEYKLVIQSLKGNEEKVKIILNKADSVPPEELIRVRGALMWNLGQILATPEVPTVLTGSFWNKRIKQESMKEKFAESVYRCINHSMEVHSDESAFLRDYEILMNDFRNLPKTVKSRKINDMIKRAKMVKIHATLMTLMLKKKHWFVSRKTGLTRLSGDRRLEKIFGLLTVAHRINPSDLPNKQYYQDQIRTSDVKRWKRSKKRQIADITEFLEVDVKAIIAALPGDEQIIMADVAALKYSLQRLQMSPLEEPPSSYQSDSFTGPPVAFPQTSVSRQGLPQIQANRQLSTPYSDEIPAYPDQGAFSGSDQLAPRQRTFSNNAQPLPAQRSFSQDMQRQAGFSKNAPSRQRRRTQSENMQRQPQRHYSKENRRRSLSRPDFQDNSPHPQGIPAPYNCRPARSDPGMTARPADTRQTGQHEYQSPNWLSPMEEYGHLAPPGGVLVHGA